MGEWQARNTSLLGLHSPGGDCGVVGDMEYMEYMEYYPPIRPPTPTTTPKTDIFERAPSGCVGAQS